MKKLRRAGAVLLVVLVAACYWVPGETDGSVALLVTSPRPPEQLPVETFLLRARLYGPKAVGIANFNKNLGAIEIEELGRPIPIARAPYFDAPARPGESEGKFTIPDVAPGTYRLRLGLYRPSLRGELVDGLPLPTEEPILDGLSKEFQVVAGETAAVSVVLYFTFASVPR